MKKLVTFILFQSFWVSCLFAQHADTTKIIVPVFPETHMEDLLPQRKDNPRKDPPVLLDDYLMEGLPVLSDDPMTFSLPSPRKKNYLVSPSYAKYLVPATLISYGVLSRDRKALRKLDESTHHEISEHFMGSIHIDDYAQFAPAVAVYGLDFMGIKAKHNFRDRTFVMATSHLIMAAAVQTMKVGTNVERPDGSNMRSFPSGHTATAFVGAHILFKEYKDVSPWIGVAGYTVAAGTGALRVVNKKHWVSDVVTGAGVGILSAEIGYLLLPVFHNVFGINKNKKTFAIAPVIGADSYGVGFSCRF